jgi:hypothetical protein
MHNPALTSSAAVQAESSVLGGFEGKSTMPIAQASVSVRNPHSIPKVSLSIRPAILATSATL